MVTLRSTSSSGIMQSNGGHRAEMAFVSVLFACCAIALWSERGTDVLCALPNSSDSLERFCRHYSHSPIPQRLLCAFFPVCAGGSDNRRRERPTAHADANRSSFCPHGDPSPALPSIAGIPVRSRTWTCPTLTDTLLVGGTI